MDLGSLIYKLGIEDNMSESLEKIIKEITAFKDTTKTAVNSVSESLTKMDNSMATGLEKMNATNSMTADGIMELQKQMSELIEITKQMSTASRDDGTRVKALNDQVEALEEVKERTEDVTKATTDQIESMESDSDVLTEISEKISDIAIAAGAMFSFDKLVDFGQDILQVRMKMTSLKKSFESLLGSQDKANAMFEELNDYATSTPMQIDELAEGMQTMLSFGLDEEKVVPILKEIGDISMGDAQRFNSLTLAFSQMSSTGKLMGQDLMQMVNAGFNPLNEIAKKTGKSVGELKEDMSKGKISVQMVEDAFASATSEGGQFYKMLEKQSDSLQGAISNFEGAIANLKNELGQTAEGPMTDMYNMGTKLINNYQTVAAVLETLIAAVGSYKASLMVLNAVNKVQKIRQAAQAYGSLSEAIKKTAVAQKILNSAMIKNPWIAIATAITAASVALYKYVKISDENAARQRNAEYHVNQLKKQQEEQREETEKLISTINDETKSELEKIQAYERLIKILPALSKKYKSYKDIQQSGGSNAQKEVSEIQARDKYVDAVQKFNEALALKQRAQKNQLSLYANREATIKRANEDMAKYWETIKAYRDTGMASGSGRTDQQIQQEVQALEEEIQDTENSIQQREAALAKLEAEGIPDEKQNIERFKKQLAREKKEKQKEIDQNAKEDERTITQARKDLAARKDELQAYIAQTAEDARQADISMEREGLKKTLDQIDYDYDQVKKEIEKERTDKLKDLQQDEWTKFLTTGAGAAYTRTHPDDVNGQEWLKKNNKVQSLPSEWDQAFSDKETDEFNKWSISREKAIAEALSDYDTLQKKIAEVNSKYRDLAKEATSGQMENITKAKNEEINQLLTEGIGQQSKTASMAFEDLEDVSVQALHAIETALKKVGDGLETSLTPDEMMVITNKVKELQQAEKGLTNSGTGLVASFKERRAAYDEYIDALNHLRRVQISSESTLQDIDSAMERYDKASKRYKKATENCDQATEEWGQTLQQLGSTIEQVGDNFSGILKDSLTIIGTITQTVGTAIDGMKAASIEGSEAIKNVERASVILTVISAVIQAANKITEMLQKDSKTFDEIKKPYEDYIDTLDKVIEKEKEVAETLNAQAETEEYKKIVDNLNEQRDAYTKLADEYMKYAESYNWFQRKIQGKSSMTNAQDLMRNLSTDSLKDLYSSFGNGEFENSVFAQSGNGLLVWFENNESEFKKEIESIFNLTGDELTAFREKHTQLWSELPDEIREYLESVIEIDEQIEQATLDHYSNLLDFDLDSFADGFKDLMLDCDSTVSDFSNSMSEQIKNALVNQAYQDEFKQRYTELYKKMGAAMENGDFEDNIDDFQEEIKGIATDWTKKMEAIKAILPTESLSSLSGALSSASQESIDLLAGQCNAIRVHQVEGIEVMRQQLLTMNNIYTRMADSNVLLTEIRDAVNDTHSDMRAYGIK